MERVSFQPVSEHRAAADASLPRRKAIGCPPTGGRNRARGEHSPAQRVDQGRPRHPGACARGAVRSGVQGLAARYEHNPGGFRGPTEYRSRMTPPRRRWGSTSRLSTARRYPVALSRSAAARPDLCDDYDDLKRRFTTGHGRLPRCQRPLLRTCRAVGRVPHIL